MLVMHDILKSFGKKNKLISVFDLLTSPSVLFLYYYDRTIFYVYNSTFILAKKEKEVYFFFEEK